MPRYKTQTFVENRWYRRLTPGKFEELTREESKEGQPIDQQVSDWVDQTGNVVVHPGQLGIHTQWYGNTGDPQQLKCVTFGLTVLYVEPNYDGPTTPGLTTEPATEPAGLFDTTVPISSRAQRAGPGGSTASPVDGHGDEGSNGA